MTLDIVMDHVDRLVLEHVEQELAKLRAEFAAEVRTRSLVVVDEGGAERIRTRVQPGVTSLEVDAPGRYVEPDGSTSAATGVSICAGDDDRGGGSASVRCWSVNPWRDGPLEVDALLFADSFGKSASLAFSPAPPPWEPPDFPWFVR